MTIEELDREILNLHKEIRDKDEEIERLKAALDAIDDHGRALSFVETLNAQKAEIVRLKEENAHFEWRDKDKNKLITELADALFDIAPDPLDDCFGSLIDRAREAK